MSGLVSLALLQAADGTGPQASLPDAMLVAFLAVPGLVAVWSFKKLSREDELPIAGSAAADYVLASALVGVVVYALIVAGRFAVTRNLELLPSLVLASEQYLSVYVASTILAGLLGGTAGWLARKLEERATGATIHADTILEAVPTLFEKPVRVALTLSGGRTVRGVWRSDDEHGLLLDDPVEIRSSGDDAATSARGRPTRERLGEALYVRHDEVAALSVYAHRTGDSPSPWQAADYERRLPVDEEELREDGVLTGVVTNELDATLAYVLVTADFLDDDGVLVDRATDEVTDLRPGQQWAFDVEPTSAAHPSIEEPAAERDAEPTAVGTDRAAGERESESTRSPSQSV